MGGGRDQIVMSGYSTEYAHEGLAGIGWIQKGGPHKGSTSTAGECPTPYNGGSGKIV